jgi:5-methylcytosine-specific restriction endonuclease McrA
MLSLPHNINSWYGPLLEATKELPPPVKAKPNYHKRLYVYDRESELKRLPDTFTAAQEQYCLKYWRHKCCLCGDTDHLQMDHWLPVTGRNCPGTVVWNMVPMCRACNVAKSNRPPREWVSGRHGAVKLKQITNYLTLVSHMDWTMRRAA